MPEIRTAAETPVLERSVRDSLQEALRTETSRYRIKQWAWRITAALAWVQVILLVLGVERALDPVLRVASGSIQFLVSACNLVPSNTRYLAPLLKIGWVLLITNFEAAGFLAFAVYCMAAPLTLPFFLLLRQTAKKITEKQLAEAKQRGLPPARHRFHPRAFCASALLAWFLLYGDSAVGLQVFMGAGVAAVLFVSLILRSFSEARPRAAEDVMLFTRLEGIFLVWAGSLVTVRPPRDKGEALGFDLLSNSAHKVCRRLAVLVRGRRGRIRISAYVLGEYILSLLALGFSAVLFWALVSKAYLAPVNAPYSLLLRHTLSHFLPGIPTVIVDQGFPLWLDVGPGATSFVLFVLFVGPAASLLPIRQQAYMERVGISYQHLRKLTIFWGRFLRAARRRADSLPATR